MKFALLLGLPLAITGIETFKSHDERIKCIIDCEEHVSPCIKDEDSACFKEYRECIDHPDPISCFAKSNNAGMNKILQCFSTKCTPIEDETVEEEEDDFEEIVVGQEDEIKEDEEGGNQLPATEKTKEEEEVKAEDQKHESDNVADFEAPSKEDEKEEEISEEGEEKEEEIDDLG